MFSKLFTLLAVTLALIGCSSTQEMPVQRKAGSFTSLTFPVISDQWENGKVQLATDNRNGCAEFSNNILPAIFEKDFTLDIVGDQDIFFHITRSEQNLECNEVGFFYATRGNKYTLRLNIKNQQCVISLTEDTPDGALNKINTYPAYASRVDGIKVCTNKDLLY